MNNLGRLLIFIGLFGVSTGNFVSLSYDYPFIGRQPANAQQSSPVGGYKVYANPGEMGKIAPFYAYIYPTDTENQYVVNGLYADINILVTYDPDNGRLIFPKQQFIIGQTAYDFLTVLMEWGRPVYKDQLEYSLGLDEEGMECFYNVHNQNETDILVFNYDKWYEYSEFASSIDDVKLEPLSSYLYKTKIGGVFTYDADDWKEAGTAEFVDCWLPSSVGETGTYEVPCEVNRFNNNLILLKNPYSDQIGSPLSPIGAGSIILDIEDPECVKILPTVLSGINAKRAGVEDCIDDDILCMYNRAGGVYYLSKADDCEQEIENYKNNMDNRLSTFDGETIYVKDYCFSTSKTHFFEQRTWDENPRLGTIRLSPETLEIISTGIGAIHSTNTNYSMQVKDGRLVINGLAPNDRVDIYNLAGHLLMTGNSDSLLLYDPLPGGVYIVKINSSVFKVIL